MKKKFSKSLIVYPGLFLAFILVLSCVQLYVNADALFGSKTSDSNYWLTLSKTITPDNIGRKELIGFNKNDIRDIEAWQGVNKVYPIVSNTFKVSADGGNFIPFYTDMYLESIDNEAIDIAELNDFQVKNNTIPIIISREYLNLYNYGFALNQGLPQITESFAKKIEVNINLTLQGKMVTYKGRLVGLSDRIHSVLVPKKFLDSVNATQPDAAVAKEVYTRVLVKVDDARDQDLISKMNSKGYESNQESLRSAKIKGKLFLVLRAIALIGIFIFLLCVFMIVNVIKLEFLERREEVSIKYSLGYSPSKMVKSISRKFSINVAVIVLIALLVIAVGQYYMSLSPISNGNLSAFITFWLWAAVVVIPVLLFWTVYGLIYKWLIRSWNF